MRQLASLGTEVVGIVYRHPLDLAGFDTVTADLRDAAGVRRLLGELRPRAVLHAAAATNVDWCETHPEEAARINVEATAGLAKAARELGTRFVHFSTDLVFDGTSPPYDEESPARPLSHYGRTKRAAEEAVLALDPSALVLRVALLYGRGSPHGGTFFDALLARLARGEVVDLFTDQFRTPALLADIARAADRALQREASGLYHLGGPERLSRFAFGQAVCRAWGYREDLLRPASYLDHAFAGPRPADCSLRTERARRDLGVRFQTLAEGLDEIRRESEDRRA